MQPHNKMNIISIIFAYFCLCTFGGHAEDAETFPENNDTVVLTSILFRHGRRTVDAGTVYPTDPHINETYFPYGHGQLTSKGKRIQYDLGTELRHRYNTLMGELYYPEIIEAVSTNVNRTKASLALVLAGLYPPKGNLMDWHPNLDWQPIPYNYLDYQTDEHLSIPMYFCPNYAKEYTEYLKTPDGKAIQKEYDDLYTYLTINTGKSITKPYQIFSVHSCLSSQTEWGLELPEWTKKIWPERLDKACKFGLASAVATPKLNQLGGGFLVKRIINIMKAKAAGTLYPEQRKMYLYSAHDINIVYLLGALNSFTPHIVPYTACVFIELHYISNKYYVKVLYEDYTETQPKAITIPGCERLCPLDKFEEVLKSNLPEDGNPCHDSYYHAPSNEDPFQVDYYLGRLHEEEVFSFYSSWNKNVKSKHHSAVIGNGRQVLTKLYSFAHGVSLTMPDAVEESVANTTMDNILFKEPSAAAEV